jgi:NAD(P)-dependent dehydrogenase (short-subunit alcohol dehydrogenase family)
MNNAGVSAGGGPFDDYEGWQRVLSVNLWGVINGVHTFAQAMIDQGTPAAIVNTCSKQGITCPPGNTAYNVTKAGVKVLSEGLAHALRNIEGCQVTAHLLVPGSTFTGMTARARTEKPSGSWMPEQVGLYDGGNGGGRLLHHLPRQRRYPRYRQSPHPLGSRGHHS